MTEDENKRTDEAVQDRQDAQAEPTLTEQVEDTVPEQEVPDVASEGGDAPSEQQTDAEQPADDNQANDSAAVTDETARARKATLLTQKPKTPFKELLKKYMPLAFRVTFIAAVVLLVVYVLLVLTSSGEYFDEFTERTAYIAFEEDIDKAEDMLRYHYNNLYGVVGRLEGAESLDRVKEIMTDYEKNESVIFGDLRYYNDARAYSCQGVDCTEDNERMNQLAQGKQEGCIFYYDKSLRFDCIAFYAPVRGSEHVDGVVSIVPARGILSDMQSILRENSDAVLLMTSAGGIMGEAYSADFAYTAGNDFSAFLSKMTGDKESVGVIMGAVHEKKQAVNTLATPYGDYTLTMAPIKTLSGELLLVTLSASEGIVAPEMVFLRHVTNISVLIVVALVVGLGYLLAHYKRTKLALVSAGSLDPVVGCANGEQFRHDVRDKLTDTRHRYAVMVVEIRRYLFMAEHLKENDLTEVLQYVAKIIETFCHVRETYGYLGEGRFGILLLYGGEGDVRDRVRLLEAVADKHVVLGSGGTKRRFNVGVAPALEVRRYSTQDFINHAGMACEKAKTDMTAAYVMYSENLNAERTHNDRIEAEMERALVNREFRLFLQPKYSVAGDRIDSAEALVRWFDPKTGEYRFPGEFIGLFETNGFIAELDHFMYTETLKCLSEGAERGDKIVPISVNVSLVTASAPDFLDFYIDHKKKYGVGDGFITIEFTESFAMGDYDKIRHIVEVLHENGIRCSLDDFGTGYSSLGVLKNLPVDELKFDRMFLRPGINRKNDEILLETLMSMAKSMGMRVVQEGVETKEMFDHAVAMGCDVVQGYYYAKAIPVEEYKLFVNTNTSIKYKSRVK